jgi:hypothetical protein
MRLRRTTYMQTLSFLERAFGCQVAITPRRQDSGLFFWHLVVLAFDLVVALPRRVIRVCFLFAVYESHRSHFQKTD